MDETSRDEITDALLLASRAMVALAARTLAELDPEVTLAQSRALIVLASRGPQRVTDIAADLGVAPSTATRMCDRLVRKGLIRRYRTAANRREVRLSLTPSGQALVKALASRRRAELARYVQAIAPEEHKHVTAALRSFSSAAGEQADRDWWFETLPQRQQEARQGA